MAQMIHVVVIDDEEILLGAVADWLAQSGPGVQVVATATNVDTALETPIPPGTVAVLDLRLRDGNTPSNNIRRLLAAGYIVVACSSRNDHRWIREAIAAGAHSYVRKAKDPAELRLAIENATTGSRYTSAAHAAAIQAIGPGTTSLSIQEREVLRLYAGGMTIAEVAATMRIKVSTAKGYLDRVRDKYDELGRPARTKIELRERAVEDGLLPTTTYE